MASFQFMVLCRSASMRESDGMVSLLDVVTAVSGSPVERLPLAVVLGLVMSRDAAGRCLVATAHVRDRTGSRRPLPGYVGTPLELGGDPGPCVLPYELAIPTPSTGIYGVDLIDRDGVLGEPMACLAQYSFFVEVRR